MPESESDSLEDAKDWQQGYDFRGIAKQWTLNPKPLSLVPGAQSPRPLRHHVRGEKEDATNKPVLRGGLSQYSAGQVQNEGRSQVFCLYYAFTKAPTSVSKGEEGCYWVDLNNLHHLLKRTCSKVAPNPPSPRPLPPPPPRGKTHTHTHRDTRTETHAQRHTK